MAWHTVVLDDSFENIGALPLQIQEEIGLVLRGLEHDAYFWPDDDYVTQRDGSNFIACEHVRGWGDWVLCWYFEYWSSTMTAVQNVVVLLHRRSPEETVYEVLIPKC